MVFVGVVVFIILFVCLLTYGKGNCLSARLCINLLLQLTGKSHLMINYLSITCGYVCNQPSKFCV